MASPAATVPFATRYGAARSSPFLLSRPRPNHPKALLGLHYKKVHFKELTFDLSNKPKELLEMNPAGTVPVLKGVDGKIITESEGMIRREKKKA